MSELRHTPKVPDFMPDYRGDEKALARQKQQEDADRKKAEADRKKAKRNRVLASVAGGAALLTGGVFAGISLGGGETSTEPRTEPSASAPATPGEVSPEQATIEAMDAMTPEEFGALPVKDQVEWVVAEANKAWNVEEGYNSDELATLMALDSVNNVPIDGYNPVYTPLGPEAEPTDILGQQVFFDQLSSYKNADIGHKLLSGFILAGSQAYESYYDTIGDTPNNPLGLKDANKHIVVASQMLANYVSDDGTEYPQMSITEKDNDTVFLETYVFVESKTLQDLTQTPDAGLWLLTNFESVPQQ